MLDFVGHGISWSWRPPLQWQGIYVTKPPPLVKTKELEDGVFWNFALWGIYMNVELLIYAACLCVSQTKFGPGSLKSYREWSFFNHPFVVVVLVFYSKTTWRSLKFWAWKNKVATSNTEKQTTCLRACSVFGCKHTFEVQIYFTIFQLKTKRVQSQSICSKADLRSLERICKHTLNPKQLQILVFTLVL